MSFGFSVSDITSLIQLTADTYRGWRDACGEYATVTGELENLEIILLRVESEVKTSSSLLHKHHAQLQSVTTNCARVIKRLNKVLSKYKSLGTNRQKNWERIRLSNENLSDLRDKLVAQITALNAFLDVVGIGSLGRMENVVLPGMVETIDKLAAEIRAGRREGSVMTTFEDDEKHIWRQFRRELISEGFSSAKLKRASPFLRAYLQELSDAGQLDEEVPEKVEDPVSKGGSISEQASKTNNQPPESYERPSVESECSDDEMGQDRTQVGSEYDRQKEGESVFACFTTRQEEETSDIKITGSLPKVGYRSGSGGRSINVKLFPSLHADAHC